MKKQTRRLSQDAGEFLLYVAADGAVNVRVTFKDETAWLTQKTLAELFGVKPPAISKHIKNIFESGELLEVATVSKMETVAIEGDREVRRTVELYNLDVIIAVGYRVNSYQATQFRIWATKVLREFMIKGFALDDERLKRGTTTFGKDYFDELLERIREIRASERRFYRRPSAWPPRLRSSLGPSPSPLAGEAGNHDRPHRVHRRRSGPRVVHRARLPPYPGAGALPG